MTNLTLGDNDCALIFRDNNDMEIQLPSRDADEIVPDKDLFTLALAHLITTANDTLYTLVKDVVENDFPALVASQGRVQ
jgi:hypothetical protein